MKLPQLVGERVVVRELQSTDLAELAEVVWVGDDEGRARWLAWQIESYRQLEALMQTPFGDRAVALRRTGEVVGLAGLVASWVPVRRTPVGFGLTDRWGPEVGLFYGLRRRARGNGYATEAASLLVDWALRELRLDRVVATTERLNVPSTRVMRRLGMSLLEHEGEPEFLQVVGVLGHEAW